MSTVIKLISACVLIRLAGLVKSTISLMGLTGLETDFLSPSNWAMDLEEVIDRMDISEFIGTVGYFIIKD